MVNWCNLTSDVFLEKNKSSDQEEQNIGMNSLLEANKSAGDKINYGG